MPAADGGASVALFRPPAPWPRPAVRALLHVLLQGERNLLSLLPIEAYRMRIGRLGWSRRGIVLVNDPALVAEVLRDPEQVFPKNDLMVDALQGLVGDSMFVISGSAWARQRRMIEPAFSLMRMDRAYAGMSAAVDDHVHALQREAQHGTVLSLDAMLSRLTADIVCRAIFSAPLESGTARGVFEDFLVFERSCANVDVGRLILGRPWGVVAQPVPVRDACRRIRDRIGQLIDDHRARVARGEPGEDIAQALMTARDPDTGEGFSREELIDQLGVFFLAGHETTASALTWALFVLAQQPAMAERLCAEVLACTQHGPLDADRVRGLSFTRNVFREALRLYPPITFIPRVAARDTVLGGFRLKRGNMIMIAPWTLHRHADLWRDADRFDPDRFAASEDRAHAAGAYIPFGQGPRVCVGAAFATLEASLILARLCTQFRFEVLDADQVRPAARLTTRPEREIRVRLHLRKPQDEMRSRR